MLYWGLGLPAALVVLAWMSVLCSPFVIDDAFIGYRYAENLVRGYGLVFTPGVDRLRCSSILFSIEKEGTYDLAHPAYYDEAMSVLIIKRREAGWNP